MKTIALLALTTFSLAFGACQHTAATRPNPPEQRNIKRGANSDGRPFNAMNREFEDPTSPGHKTSPGDAR